MQVLAVVGDLIQPLVVVDLVDAGATTERVRVLVRILVHEQVIAPPAKVVLGAEVADDVVVPATAVLFVLAAPIVDVAVAP
jgi:predicted transcriptional regulator